MTQSKETQQMEILDMEERKILVAYFSSTSENYSVGYIEKGNTHKVADIIAGQTGGDMFEIRTVTPYPDEYNECTEAAKQEQDENARPELAESVESYDVIFLGYPNMEQGFESVLYTWCLKIEDNKNCIHKKRENCVSCWNSCLAEVEFWAAFYVAL